MSEPLARFKGLAATLIAAALALAWEGCVDQAHEVHLYREVLDDHRPAPEAYKPGEHLSLDRAMALANANNEQLASHGEDYLQVLIQKNRAFASFLPTLSFQPNFTVEQAPKGKGATASPGAPQTSAAAVAASQGGFVQDGSILRRFEAPVVGAMTFSYRDVPAYEGAKSAVIGARQTLIDSQQTILLNVAQAYFQVLTTARQEGVLKHSLALQEARVNDLTGRVKVRLALGLDLDQARANEAATRVQLLHASSDARNARRMLALLIGVPAVDGSLDDRVLALDALPPQQAFVDQAMKDRQDLAAAHQAVETAHDAVRSAIAEYYPSVSLNVAGYLYRENYSNASKWDGILAANLPLFTGGQIRADVRTAWSKLRQAALAESYLRRDIEQGVQTAYDNLVTSRASVDELGYEVEAASRAYTQSVQMERNGLAIPLDVLTAQDTLLNAQLQYVNEAFARSVFYLDLLRSSGVLTPVTPQTLQWTPLPEPGA